MGRTKANVPSKLKQTLGTERPRGAKTRPVKRRPVCPTFLDDEAKKVWKQTCDLLEEAQLLERTDQHTLETYVITVTELRKAYKIVARDGAFDYTGQTRESVESKSLRALAELQKKYICELGLSPAARKKLDIKPDIDPEKAKEVSSLTDLVSKMKTGNGKS